MNLRDLPPEIRKDIFEPDGVVRTNRETPAIVIAFRRDSLLYKEVLAVY